MSQRQEFARLSAKIGIAPSSMVRCARELGFAGYREMREWYRDYLRSKKLPGSNSSTLHDPAPGPF